MKKVASIFYLLIPFYLLIGVSTYAQINITYNINTSLERKPISSLIYGINCNLPVWSRSRTENITARRMGGNRLTAYNWEHNFSNAGTDWGPYANDLYLFQMLLGPTAPTNQNTGEVLKIFHDTSLAVGTYSLVTVPIAGKVSDNNTGNSSARVNQTMNPVKGSAFTLTPNKTDGQVYADEMVNWIVNRYGNASTANGVKGYSLDNEPDLWSSTHGGWFGGNVTCSTLVRKNTDYSKAIKAVDPNAEIFGFVSYGCGGWFNLQGASDWGSASYPATPGWWFIDHYLDKMKTASTTAGYRLIDVLDLHFYSEHRGNDNGGTPRRVWDESNPSWENHTGVAQARIQAPRSLWDPNFTENSWIPGSGWFPSSQLQVIPTLQNKINARWPGTKLGFSEWSYSGEGHVSGGLAVADALGIYGKYDMYFATYWGEIVDWISAGFKLYRNYDGSKGTFENTHVRAEPGAASDWANTSIYASVNNATDTKLHLIVLNKHWTSSINATFNVTSATSYTTAKIYGFNSSTSNISLITTISNITGNSFSYTIPNLTALHIVLESGTLPVELKSFTGKAEGNKAVLTWETSSEEDMNGYEIFRSNTGEEDSWEKIGFVESTNFKDFNQKYSFHDHFFSQSTGSYYKLNCVERNGSVSASSIIFVKSESDIINAYPNPFTEGFTIMPGKSREEVKVIIKDSAGKIISEQVSSGGAELYFSLDTCLPGIYFAEVIRKGEVKVIKMVRN